MPLREYGCSRCSLIIDDIQYGDPSAPRSDVLDAYGKVLNRNGPIISCPSCGNQEWLYVKKTYRSAIKISDVVRKRPSSPWQRLRAEREVFPIKSNFVKKTPYIDKLGNEKVHRQRLTFNTRPQYEEYMKVNGFMYYEEPSHDVRDDEFIDDEHKRLHKELSGRYKSSGTHEYMTEQELEDAIEVC